MNKSRTVTSIRIMLLHVVGNLKSKDNNMIKVIPTQEENHLILKPLKCHCLTDQVDQSHLLMRTGIKRNPITQKIILIIITIIIIITSRAYRIINCTKESLEADGSKVQW